MVYLLTSMFWSLHFVSANMVDCMECVHCITVDDVEPPDASLPRRTAAVRRTHVYCTRVHIHAKTTSSSTRLNLENITWKLIDSHELIKTFKMNRRFLHLAVLHICIYINIYIHTYISQSPYSEYDTIFVIATELIFSIIFIPFYLFKIFWLLLNELNATSRINSGLKGFIARSKAN